MAQQLLEWYARRRRSLPWRDHPDPYAVLVAEVMAQQTRLETVLPYFQRWMARFPTVEALARAEDQEVLALWEGLGYYRRARHLHRAAREIVARHDGHVPADPRDLMALPGIGPYTAAAVASIAFGRDVPVVDGNVLRVFARLFAVEAPVDTAAGRRTIERLAAEHLPPGQASAYNQALMDLGAQICTPRQPQCARCPLRDLCRAYAQGEPTAYPRRKPKRPTPHYTVTAAVIRRDGQVLLAQRPAEGLLGNLWEFPGGKVEPGESLEEALVREIHEELAATVQVEAPFGVYRHAYSHFKVTLHAFLCRLVAGEPRPVEAQTVRWVPLAALDEFPMGKIDRRIARRLQKEAARS
ncbi:MAG TPA: A/G-specific adenine glycosylase [Anaerolineaceae bacterium]|nr:A/G-specific adenine glycosylase [Anaerolineales bacterium]HIQ09605.1 A/G-specific adenine glycosylase [Anaerolineaceae bacterium]